MRIIFLKKGPQYKPTTNIRKHLQIKRFRPATEVPKSVRLAMASWRHFAPDYEARLLLRFAHRFEDEPKLLVILLRSNESKFRDLFSKIKNYYEKHVFSSLVMVRCCLACFGFLQLHTSLPFSFHKIRRFSRGWLRLHRAKRCGGEDVRHGELRSSSAAPAKCCGLRSK